VATLGGVKALDGFEAIGVDLVKQLHRQLLAVSIHQVQAIVSASDRVTPTILANSGFRLLTVVHHLWLELALSNSKFNDNASTFSSSTVHWLAASHVAKTRMAKLVESTFHQTLDCPELNGLRTPDDVLDGFLDGRTYREQYLWEILRVDDQDAGCLLLSAHGGNVAELVYMGLKPEMRGRGLGDHMVQRGITTAQRMGMNLLVVAVDQGNWPAIANYRRAGFQSHQSLSVWLAHGPD
jgi:ribosomal protein S18 acetylase RimI-like enzyme